MTSSSITLSFTLQMASRQCLVAAISLRCRVRSSDKKWPRHKVANFKDNEVSFEMTSGAVERGSTSFHKMNSTAIDRERSKETHFCNHELLWHGWLRDALPAGVIFRPYSAGTVHRKPIGESDAPKATAREAQAINASEHLSSYCKISLAAASRVLAGGAPISSQHPGNNYKGLWPRNRNKTKDQTYEQETENRRYWRQRPYWNEGR